MTLGTVSASSLVERAQSRLTFLHWDVILNSGTCGALPHIVSKHGEVLLAWYGEDKEVCAVAQTGIRIRTTKRTKRSRSLYDSRICLV